VLALSRPNEIARGYTEVQGLPLMPRVARQQRSSCPLGWKLPNFVKSALIKFARDGDDFQLPAMWAGYEV
jgi:hypothetical protein